MKPSAKKRPPYSNTATEVPAISADFKDAVRALLHTPPPPPGDPSTRKAKPKTKAAKKKVRGG